MPKSQPASKTPRSTKTTTLKELERRREAGDAAPAYPAKTAPAKKKKPPKEAPETKANWLHANGRKPDSAHMRARSIVVPPANEPKPVTTAEVIEHFGGMDKVAQLIEDGASNTAVAKYIGVTVHQLRAWIRSDEDRHAAYKVAIENSADAIAERGRQEIVNAGDEFELRKAIALEQHDKWMAGIRKRTVYGNRTTVDLNEKKDEAPDAVEAELIRRVEQAKKKAAFMAETGQQ